MAHPQNSPRGYAAHKRLDIGGLTQTYNSTALLLSGGLRLSGQAVFGLLSANSTALILPNSVRVGTKTTYLSSNTTGVRLGSLYISCNSTGNTTT